MNTNLKSNPDFEDVFKEAKKIDQTLGLILFKEKSVNRTWIERLFLLNIPSNLVIVFTFGVTTVVVSHFSLLSIFLCSSIYIVFLSHYFGIAVMIQHKHEINGFFNWCRKIFNIEEEFHPIQQKRARFHIKFVHKWSIRLMKWMKIILYCDAFLITILVSIIGYYLPDTIYPDFMAPLPYVLPFKNQKSMKTYVITVILQYQSAICLCSYSIFVFGLFYIISMCVLTYLNIILDTIQIMQRQIKDGENEFYNTENLDEAGNDDDDTKIDVIRYYSNGTSLEISEWIKIIVKMICDVNEIITAISNVFSGFFLTLEFSSFGALFIFGLELLVVREQFLYAFGVLTITVFLFIFCFINEKILDKFNDIEFYLYDIPWYYLAPKKRKDLFQTLLCGRIQNGLTAAGLHSLTIERFGHIVQAAYTNCLIIRDLLEAH